MWPAESILVLIKTIATPTQQGSTTAGRCACNQTRRHGALASVVRTRWTGETTSRHCNRNLYDDSLTSTSATLAASSSTNQQPPCRLSPLPHIRLHRFRCNQHRPRLGASASRATAAVINLSADKLHLYGRQLWLLHVRLQRCHDRHRLVADVFDESISTSPRQATTSPLSWKTSSSPLQRQRYVVPA